jgi:Novel STAND NTPase 1
MLVLFAKPGLGKTSLLRVHLFPRLRERDFLPVPVRFNHAYPAFTPMQVFTAAIDETCAAEAIDYTAGDPKSRWALFKTAIFRRGDRLQTTVLILDQFEEIFTLQREEFRHAAAAELGQLLWESVARAHPPATPGGAASSLQRQTAGGQSPVQSPRR